MAIQAAKSGGRPQAWYESVPSISNNAKKITSVRRIWRAVAKQNVPERKVGRPSVVNEDLVKRAQIYRDAEYAARGGHGRVTQGKVAGLGFIPPLPGRVSYAADQFEEP